MERDINTIVALGAKNGQPGGSSSRQTPPQQAPYGNPFYIGIAEAHAQRYDDFSNMYSHLERLQSWAEDANAFYGTWHSREEREAFRNNLGIDSAKEALENLKKSYAGKPVKEIEDFLARYMGSIGQYEDYWSKFGSQEEYDGFQRLLEHLAAPMAEVEKARAAAEEAQKNLETFQQRGRPVWDDPKYIEKYLGYYDEETAANLANDDFIADLTQYDQKEAELGAAAEAAKTEWERQQYALEEARQGYFQDNLNNLIPDQLPAWARGGDSGADWDALLEEAEEEEKSAQEEYERFLNEEPLGTGWWRARNVREDQAEILVQKEYIKAKTREYMDMDYPQPYAEEFAKRDYEQAKMEYDAGLRQRYQDMEDAKSYAQGQRNLKHNRDVDAANMQELYAMSEETKETFLNYLRATEALATGGGDSTAQTLQYMQYMRSLESQYGSKRLRELEETYGREQDKLKTQLLALQTEAWAQTGGAAVIPAYLLSFPAKLIGSISGTLGTVGNKLGGTGQYVGFNPYSSGNLLNVYADTLRGTMAGEIKGDGSSGWRNLAGYGFQAFNSAADSVLRVAAAGPYSLALSASATFNDTILDASRKGASTEEAVLLGLVNAGIETATEKIPLDILLDTMGSSPKMGMDFLKKAFLQGGIEVTTEELSLVGTTLAEMSILRQSSGYAATIREQMANGATEQEAIVFANQQLLEEAKETMIVSFLSGEMSYAGGSAIGAIRNPGDPMNPNTAAPPDIQQTNQEQGNPQSMSVMDASRGEFLMGVQEAMRKGLTEDQAIQYTAVATAMKIGTQNTSIEVLLDSMGGDPKKAAQIIDGILKESGIQMTPTELNWFGNVAAKVSALQQNPAFATEIALEMLDGKSPEEAQTAASQALWQRTLDRAITSKDFGLAQPAAVIDTEAVSKYDKRNGLEVWENGSGEMGNDQISKLIQGSSGEQASGDSTETRRSDRAYVKENSSGTAGRNISIRDSEGRGISREQMAHLQGTAITDANGAPIALYHSTGDMEFTVFQKGDVGFHFGTEEQARSRRNSMQYTQGRTFRVYLNIQNPFQANEDIMCWDAPVAAGYLYSEGILSDSEYFELAKLREMEDSYDSPMSVRLREMLKSKGYDGIAYPNAVEGAGQSYIAFEDDQIIRSEITNYGLEGEKDRQSEAVPEAVEDDKIK